MAIRLLILGGGHMGDALVSGLVASGTVAQSECAVVEPKEAVRLALKGRFEDLVVVQEPVPADAVVIAVKPGDVKIACASLANGAYGRVLSIAAGVSTRELESYLEPGLSVVRAMPNTPALVGASASAISAGSCATEADLAWAESLLSPLGLVVVLPETLLDSVTGLSGSGPAYVFLVAEAMIEAGVLVGLDRDVARALTIQTILGSARMLAESDDSAESLRHRVTSPGGTTAAGLRVLEEKGVRSAFLGAVVAASDRSRSLGRPPA